MQLFDRQGKRLYFTAAERAAFMHAALQAGGAAPVRRSV